MKNPVIFKKSFVEQVNINTPIKFSTRKIEFKMRIRSVEVINQADDAASNLQSSFIYERIPANYEIMKKELC